MPVMDEPDVVEVLPLVRLSRDALLEQRDRLIGTAGPAGRRFAQEDRAEPVRDGEVRIERGRQIEQRMQQLVLAGVHRAPGDRRRSAGSRGSSRRRRPARRTRAPCASRRCLNACRAAARWRARLAGTRRRGRPAAPIGRRERQHRADDPAGVPRASLEVPPREDERRQPAAAPRCRPARTPVVHSM